MKPSFALNLSPDGISLLHRTIRGWLLVGEAALDAPDLADSLAYLRATALGLEPKGLSSKLILPESQVLYTWAEAPGPSEAERRSQIAAALEGITPYAVKDLVFDWAGTGHEVQVAVVARETLDEAEGFAAQHRFNPLCFVAQPDPTQFPREPFFGPTEMAATMLPEGEEIARDVEVVTIIGRASLPEAGRAAAVAEPGSEDAPGADAARGDKAGGDVAPAADAAPDAAAGPRASVLAPGLLDDADTPARSSAAPDGAGTAAPGEGDATAPTPGRNTPPTDAPPKAEAIASTPAPDPLRGQSAVQPGKAAESLAPAGTRRKPARRSDRPVKAPKPGRGGTPPPAEATPDAAKGARTAISSEASEGTGAGAGTKAGTEAGTGANAGPSTGAGTGAGTDASTMEGTAAATGAAAQTGAEVSVPAGPPPPQTEADALTLFGARGQDGPVTKSRLLRIVAILVVLILLGLAAVMVKNRFAAPQGAAGKKTSALSPTQPPAPPQGPAQDGTSQQASSQGQAVGAIRTPAPLPAIPAPASAIPDVHAASAEPTVNRTAPATARQPAAGGAPALPSDPVTRLVPADAVVQQAPARLKSPVPQALGPIAVTPGDRGVHQTDTTKLAAVALARADTAPATQPDPPPYGTVFDLNAQGLVKATPEGAMTPQGVMVYLGAPKVIPPLRPIVKLAPGTDPALANARPKPRPADLTAGASASASASEGGDTAGATAADAPAPGTAAAQISPLAVGTSPVPEQRPADFNKDVKEALAAANAGQPTSDELSDSEPELKAMLRGNPTKASVARRATVKRALPLNRLALLGIFGPEDARKAMLRTAHGKILKVAVGDRLDGGVVTAIGPDRLYYRKNGRDVVLAMPKG